MRRRGREPEPEPRAPVLNAPFADLAKRVRGRPAPNERPVAPSPPPPPPPPPPEPDLFATAMAGVVPLTHGADRRVEGAPPAGEGRRPISEEAETLAVLSDLVEGGTGFDVTDTREYVEGAIAGLDPRVLRRLRRGDYSWQAHLDL
ncbi:MAG TPA: hypothetical protein VKA21_16145, partial [Candidatus Binatia bacterium]|nr:hypothetical protein [Candidatus Binatia bacterium]